jgi:UDP-N-acetylmuramate--alanine ligase
MLNAVDLSGRPFHFIGIGGIGMSALAYILTQRRLPISGSDVHSTHITEKLESLGAHIFWQQQEANLDYFQSSMAQLPQVICSTAIKDSNAEYQAAVRLGCPIFHRSDVLAALIGEAANSVSVAGTHGKTTTSSLIGHLLVTAGLDPTVVVGGEVATWQGNARVGHSDYLVAEADESDGSLVKFHSQIGVITNIELDHPDHYATLEEVVKIFRQFSEHCQHLILCADCDTIQNQFIQPSSASTPPIKTYSLASTTDADYSAADVVYGSTQTTATIYEQGLPLGQLKLKLLGRHNLSNALAAVAVGRLLGLPFDTIANALASFAGTRRRFEHRGEAQGICLIDDYAHHPSEVQATLSSARLRTTATHDQPTAFRRVVAVFQPHRYSRILAFLPEFSQSFADADCVIATDIYSAGESQPADVSGAGVAAAIAEYHAQVSYQPTLADVATYLKGHLKPGDLVIFLGAGDVNRIIPEVLQHFQQPTDLAAEVAVR